jgi:hypothetical protein
MEKRDFFKVGDVCKITFQGVAYLGVYQGADESHAYFHELDEGGNKVVVSYPSHLIRIQQVKIFAGENDFYARELLLDFDEYADNQKVLQQEDTCIVNVARFYREVVGEDEVMKEKILKKIRYTCQEGKYGWLKAAAKNFYEEFTGEKFEG